MLGFSLTERNQSLSMECAQMVCGLCLGKSEDRKHELRLFRKKSSCWWHVQLRGRCTMCTVRWSPKERLPVELLTKIWMTKNIVTSFKNLHICLVYPMVRNFRLEAVTNCSAWAFASRKESTNGWPFNPTDNSSLHFNDNGWIWHFFSDTEVWSSVHFIFFLV